MFRKSRVTYKEVQRFIETQDPAEALAQEFSYINSLYGKEGKDWFLVEKFFNMHKEPEGDYSPVDVFDIILKSGDRFQVAFEKTSFMGTDLCEKPYKSK